MRNLNEPLKEERRIPEQERSEPAEKQRGEGDVVSFPHGKGKESASGSSIPESEGQTSWDSVQARFVDDPRKAVEEADKLVGQTIQRLYQGLSDERAQLASGWSTSGEGETENLRIALQRYRSLFLRLRAI